jgi:hypothetical protein
MTEHEALELAAEQYRKEGYTIVVRPGRTELPEGLAGHNVDLLARKGQETVAVQVRRRDQLYDVEPAATEVNALPGWRFDLVVVPVNGRDEVPSNGATPSVGEVESLLGEAEQLLGHGTPRAAFLIAWSAAEGAMREAARRRGLGVEAAVPRFLLKTLLANGLISREDYDRLQHSGDVRSRLAHGLSPGQTDENDIRFLVAFARQLLTEESQPSEA